MLRALHRHLLPSVTEPAAPSVPMEPSCPRNIQGCPWGLWKTLGGRESLARQLSRRRVRCGLVRPGARVGRLRTVCRLGLRRLALEILAVATAVVAVVVEEGEVLMVG